MEDQYIKIQGTIEQIKDPETKQGKNGPIKSQRVYIKRDFDKVPMEIMARDKMVDELADFYVNQNVRAEVAIQPNYYNGRTYNNIVLKSIQ